MSVTYFVKFSSSWAEYHICPYNEWPLYFLWYMPGLQIVNFDPWWLSTEGCFLILVIVIIWPLFSLYYNWYWCVLWLRPATWSVQMLWRLIIREKFHQVWTFLVMLWMGSWWKLQVRIEIQRKDSFANWEAGGEIWSVTAYFSQVFAS